MLLHDSTVKIFDRAHLNSINVSLVKSVTERLFNDAWVKLKWNRDDTWVIKGFLSSKSWDPPLRISQFLQAVPLGLRRLLHFGFQLFLPASDLLLLEHDLLRALNHQDLHLLLLNSLLCLCNLPATYMAAHALLPIQYQITSATVCLHAVVGILIQFKKTETKHSHLPSPEFRKKGYMKLKKPSVHSFLIFWCWWGTKWMDSHVN